MPSAGLPAQLNVEKALYGLLVRRGTVTPSQAYKELANEFELTKEQRTRTLKTEDRSEWENLVRFARRRLVDQLILDKSVRGKWSLSKFSQINP